ncbi:MAG TPA: TIGR03435 family protein, partial [Acidobacteriaceae bacterium]|nr:TIGR03435 family protein [Acidobacteriaceae bacterium]
RAIVFMKQGGFIDGEAEGTNTTMDYLAARLGERLRVPVLDQTGISGSYDFYMPPSDPGNQDMLTAVISVMDRLGLKLKKGRGPVETLVIDHVERPTEN